MPLFNQSSIPWVTAVQGIADSIGASGDTEQTTRAHKSLRAAFQYIGGKVRWDFMRGEYTPQAVVAPFGVTGVSASAGQGSALVPAGHGLQPDDVIGGSYFLLGTRVSATAASSFTFPSAENLITAAGVQTTTITAMRDRYDAPPDMRNGYGIKLLSSQVPLRYIIRRAWDRGTIDEFTPSTPYGYDFFSLGGRSKIQLLPPPGSSDVLQQRYYRRFNIPAASASSTSLPLDIPEDYEEVPIAYAKWHFLTDQGEGKKQQAQTWLSMAQDGIKTMLAEQTDLPDQNLAFYPGHFPEAANDRSTRWLDWNYG